MMNKNSPNMVITEYPDLIVTFKYEDMFRFKIETVVC